jgi:hypothetical protein
MDTAMAPRSSGTAQPIRIDPAWPWDWENRPAKDDCAHVWEIIVIGRLFDPNERVARCATCHTPRCGYADDADPCALRRHHHGDHRSPVPIEELR